MEMIQKILHKLIDQALEDGCIDKKKATQKKNEVAASIEAIRSKKEEELEWTLMGVIKDINLGFDETVGKDFKEKIDNHVKAIKGQSEFIEAFKESNKAYLTMRGFVIMLLVEEHFLNVMKMGLECDQNIFEIIKCITVRNTNDDASDDFTIKIRDQEEINA